MSCLLLLRMLQEIHVAFSPSPLFPFCPSTGVRGEEAEMKPELAVHCSSGCALMLEGTTNLTRLWLQLPLWKYVLNWCLRWSILHIPTTLPLLLGVTISCCSLWMYNWCGSLFSPCESIWRWSNNTAAAWLHCSYWQHWDRLTAPCSTGSAQPKSTGPKQTI